MRFIELTQGQVAVVDEADYVHLDSYSWFAVYDPKKNSFYAARTGRKIEDGHRSMILMHRQIVGLKKGDKRKVDHLNSETLNNQRFNLRICTHQENSFNRKRNKNNRSGFKGVYFHTKLQMFGAEIRKSGRRTFLGWRSTADAAYWELRLPAELKMFGEFARAEIAN